MFGVNHLAHFLLTNLLLDLIKKSAPARIVSVSSNAHNTANLNFGDLQAEKSYTSFGRYGASKLANIYFTKELSKRLEGTGVTTYAVHPGVVNTQFFKGDNIFTKFFGTIFGMFIKTPKDGAATSIFVATDPSVANESGKYYADSKEKQPSTVAQDPKSAEQLWEVSEELVADYLN